MGTKTGPTIRCQISLAVLTLILISATFQHAQASEKSSMIEAIHLKQHHGYFGNTETWISSDAIRFNSDPKQGFSIVARSPDWSIHAFRATKKTIYSQKLQAFVETGLVSSMLFKLRAHDDLMDAPAEYGTFGSFKTIKRHIKRDFLEYIPSDKLLRHDADSVLYGINRVPTNGGITLTYILPGVKKDFLQRTNLDKHDRVLLQTSRAEYVRIAPAIFDVPARYRPVSFVQEIINAKASTAEIKDFVDSLDSPAHQLE